MMQLYPVLIKGGHLVVQCILEESTCAFDIYDITINYFYSVSSSYEKINS